MLKIFYIKSKIKKENKINKNKINKNIIPIKNKNTFTKPITPQFNSYTVKVPSEFPLDRPLTKDELIKFYEDCLDHPIWIKEKNNNFCSVAILDKFGNRLCAAWGLNGYCFIDHYGVEWEAYVYPFYDLNDTNYITTTYP